jgi:SAM-dependent methyltransferase
VSNIGARKGTYEDLAAEYYDAELHPTCANFREASEGLLAKWVGSLDAAGWIADMGAGESAVAPILIDAGTSIERLVLLDSSVSMLRHSAVWGGMGAHLLVGDSCRVPLMNASTMCVVASLGDAFNVQTFWQECARVLLGGGQVLFTTPSYEWARGFRTPADSHCAVFDLQGGVSLAVPSIILPLEEQIGLIESAGLFIKEVQEFLTPAARLTLSPKLLIGGAAVPSIATLYIATK